MDDKPKELKVFIMTTSSENSDREPAEKLDISGAVLVCWISKDQSAILD